MTATAPEMGHTWTGRPEPMTNPKAEQQCSSGFHPDVLAMAAELGITRPRTIALLQRDYDRKMADRIAAEDFTPVITAAFRGGSHNADREGDRTARRIDRERKTA